jgi:hypothetical protein
MISRLAARTSAGSFFRRLSVFWIPGYPGPPAPGPLQRPNFGPGEERRPKLSGEDPHEENDGTMAKYQKTSLIFLVRGRTTSTSARHISVLSKKIRAEDRVPSMLPPTGRRPAFAVSA